MQKMEKIQIRLRQDQLEKIDKIRDGRPRAQFIRRFIDLYIEEFEKKLKE
jgi:metal-responsive CopG/Arc/MetJ family transcriptional regulator